ncbi:MAG: phosphotransferase [Gammaproteobacteria bacterium]|nr:phosphotransferase [Gammaproteobacteria bacterium]
MAETVRVPVAKADGQVSQNMMLTHMRPQQEQKDEREQQLQHWVNQVLVSLNNGSLTDPVVPIRAVSGDASFRRYFRVYYRGKVYIAVDAPPEHEDSKAFVKVGQLLATAGVRVPLVYAADFEQGFMLLEDFGDRLLFNALREMQQVSDIEGVDRLYIAAIDVLVNFQSKADKQALGPYDRQQLNMEMAFFEEWFCNALLGMELKAPEHFLITEALVFLEDAALAQPTVVVHRDYHSRNIILPDGGVEPGIIDFQDAVSGPYTYDLVSLLRDCYISWPEPRIVNWLRYYLTQAKQQDLVLDITQQQLVRNFDLMGLQRHLKVMGIFSRLHLRDNRSGYLADIPLVIHYFLEISGRYPELKPFREWFQRSVLPLAINRLPSRQS